MYSWQSGVLRRWFLDYSSFLGVRVHLTEEGESTLPSHLEKTGKLEQLSIQNFVHEFHFTTIWFIYNEIMYIYKCKIYIFQFWLAHRKRKSASYYLISSDIRTIIFSYIQATFLNPVLILKLLDLSCYLLETTNFFILHKISYQYCMHAINCDSKVCGIKIQIIS